MTKFTTHTLTSCVPVCRSELLEDISKAGSSEKISGVWITAGHVFVGLRESTKLLTFDCKPISLHHNIGNRTLDFPSLSPPVLDIFMVHSSKAVYIVQQNGRVQCWHFTADFQWTLVTEFELCEHAETRVISICVHPGHNSLYWCERQPGREPVHRICSFSLPDCIEQLPKRSQTELSVVLEECSASDVFPLDNGIFIVPKYKERQIRVCIFWQPSIMELVSVTTVIGSKVRHLHDMRSPLRFSDVILNSLADVSKAHVKGPDFGAKKDFVTGRIMLLHANGTVQCFEAKEEEEQTSIATSSFKISMPDQLLQCGNVSDAWDVRKNIIILATQAYTVRLYHAGTGHLLHELECGGVCIQSLARVASPTILLGVVTATGVLVVQGGKAASKNSHSEPLPADKHFQTDALQVALLSQHREENPSQKISEELSSLHKKWKDIESHQPRSQLSDTVDTYLAEFWRLEEEASQLAKSQSVVSPEAHTTKEMICEAVLRSKHMAPDVAMAELLWMSQKYPEDLLQVLLGDLDVAKEDLTAEDQALWQTTLGLENADGHLNLQYSTITFELVCRLLYQLHPHLLVAFVRNAQTVSEQAVGVSAFVRRKHMHQYYTRAMECLPEPNLSCNSAMAASAKAQIILLGASDHGPELALRYLLRHCQWAEAISLLKQLGPASSHNISLFFLLLQHLMQGQALSEYASEVFALLPSWKSVLPALKVMAHNSNSQCSSVSGGLFYKGSPDIPLSALRPHLMSLLSLRRKHQQ